MTELDIDPDDLFADLFTDDGAPVELPPAVEATTETVAYTTLELQLSAIASDA